MREERALMRLDDLEFRNDAERPVQEGNQGDIDDRPEASLQQPDRAKGERQRQKRRQQLFCVPIGKH